MPEIPSRHVGEGLPTYTLLYMRRIQRVRFLVPGLVKKKLGDAFCTGGVLVEVLSVGNSVRLDSTSLLGHG